MNGYGTHWVQFQPVQVKGEIQGCQLTFLTVTADRAYLNGNQDAANGSILLRLTNNALALMLKVGLKDITSDSPFERPEFAYIQTATTSTAKAQQQVVDGDPGYKLFIYRATDSEVIQVLKEIMTSQKASIGYNRKPDGIDVLVPLDLTVIDSQYTEDLRVTRSRSPDVARAFAACAANILKVALDREK